MLVWINGAFGAGKTQTAFELHRRVPGSHVADPELIGFGIHKMLPGTDHGDFQDRPQWRSAVTATLADAAALATGPVIVPMTLVDGGYFDEIIGGLERRGVPVHHVALLATPETLRHRLRTRSAFWFGRLAGNQETWAMAQIDRCVDALRSPRFAEHIETDDRSVDDLVETIAARAGLELQVGRLSPARYQLRRAVVGVRHMRF